MCLPLQPPPHRFEGLLGGIPGLERLRSLQPDAVLAPMDGVKPLGHWDMGTQKRHLLPGSWPHRLERGSRQGGGEERRARGGRGSGQSTLLSSPVWPRLPMSGLGSVISLCSTGKAPNVKALAKATRRVPIGLDPGQAAGGGSGPSALQRVCTQPQKSLSGPQTNGPEAGTPASPCTRPDCGAPLAMMLTLGPRSFPEEVCSGPWASLWMPSGPALSLGTPSLPQASWGRGRQGVLGYFQLLVLTTLSENQVQMAGFPNTLQGWAE